MQNLRIPLAMILMLALSSLLQAQRNRTFELGVDNLYSGEAINAFDLRKVELEGSLYFSEDAMQLAAKLKNGKKLSTDSALYNLEGNLLEIFTPRGAVALPGQAVDEFVLFQKVGGDTLRHHFIAPASLPGGKRMDKVNFLRYEAGEAPILFSGIEIELFKPNYVPALDAGSRNPRAVQREKLFLYDGQSLQEIPGRRKETVEFFESQFPETGRIIAEKGLKLKEKEELIRLVNSLQGAAAEE